MGALLASLADVILVIHAMVVGFNIGALPVIWVGHLRGWHFVRNFYFRIVHLLLLGVVAAESVLGIWCPLTVWEEALRPETRHPNGFIAYWIHRLMFYDLAAWVFTVAYLLFFLLVALTFYLVPPQLPAFRKRARVNSKPTIVKERHSTRRASSEEGS